MADLHHVYFRALYLIITLLVWNNSIGEIRKKNDRNALQKVFRQELENYGRERVSTYLAYTELAYGHEWCAAFVSYCFGQIGYHSPRTPWSPSLFPKKKLIWIQAKNRNPPEMLLPGMLIGIYVPSKKRIGHVGFVDHYNKSLLTTIEGNTSDPEGKKAAGVYRKRRHWRTLHCIADWIQNDTRTAYALIKNKHKK